MIRLCITFALLSVWACSEPVAPDDCRVVCANLAEMLQADRVSNGQEAASGLKPHQENGARNLTVCLKDCLDNSSVEQLDCLKKATNLQSWQACP